MKSMVPMLMACLGLAACDSDKAPKAAPEAANAILPAEPDVAAENVAAAVAPLPTDAWIGKWVGVEGLALEIAPGPEAGQYALKVTLLDGTDNYVGTAEGETIRFTRDGKAETIREARGDKTGLKYLAGKTNCLMIKTGEGFCRD